jgi:hypothetical protein
MSANLLRSGEHAARAQILGIAAAGRQGARQRHAAGTEEQIAQKVAARPARLAGLDE